MTERAEKIIVILALAAMLAVVLTRGKAGWQYHGHAALKDTEHQMRDQDDMCVGDSGTLDNPVVTRNLANTRFVPCLPGMPAPLRQATRGAAPHPVLMGA